jgi:superfamily II DNA/RNA helicase
VVNFDLPLSLESYIHRIGRTGFARPPFRKTLLCYRCEETHEPDMLELELVSVFQGGTERKDWLSIWSAFAVLRLGVPGGQSWQADAKL